MFTNNRVTAVAKSGEVKLQSSMAVKANTGVASGFGKSNVQVGVYGASQYNYMFSGLLPATPDLPDSTSLMYFYRDIYMHDNTAGSAVDIQSVFPFSDWELTGLEDSETQIFNTALARLNIQELLPQISIAYLTDGFYAGSLIYDAQAKNFMDILTHDALQCGISPSPLNNVDPTIRVSVSGPTLRFLDSATDYARAYVKTMPRQFVDLLREGSFILDPVTTLFLGRRGLTDRAYQSYLHRILPMYLIEKTMFRGTLIEAQRRQRAMSHIAAGDDTWTPTGEELAALVQQFADAERDPLGGWVSTRNAIQIQDLRPGGDFWKWTDMADIMVSYKLRAMGISEALLSGDACLVGNTKINTLDGVVNIKDLCPVANVIPYKLPVGVWFDLKIKIPNRVSKCAETKAWSYQGYRNTFEITTEEGHTVRATDNHPFWVMDSLTKECSWKRMDELKEGDLIGVNDEEENQDH
jgi:hypothetical protein